MRVESLMSLRDLINMGNHFIEPNVRGEGNDHYHWTKMLDWLQSLKQFFINVSYHILVASLTLMALF